MKRKQLDEIAIKDGNYPIYEAANPVKFRSCAIYVYSILSCITHWREETDDYAWSCRHHSTEKTVIVITLI